MTYHPSCFRIGHLLDQYQLVSNQKRLFPPAWKSAEIAVSGWTLTMNDYPLCAMFDLTYRQYILTILDNRFEYYIRRTDIYNDLLSLKG